ncbi:hypothetical protein HY631_01455 [Candidatus Uhrbacteria bacterium]|nr:hypothetical protein [Candidatus Uhrbacteria bacterium]
MKGRNADHANRSVAAVVAIVLVASAFLFLRGAPEQVVGVSQDGLVRASGLTRSAGSLVVERIDDVETSVTAVRSPVYEVSFTGNGRLDQGELVMEIDEDESLSDSALYAFDRETLNWIELPTLFDLSHATLSTSLSFSGSLLVVAGARE